MNFNSYGDIYTVTVVGRIIACLCALSGAVVLGMLVSVLVERYQRVFNEDMELMNQKHLLEEFPELNRDHTEEETEVSQESSGIITNKSKCSTVCGSDVIDGDERANDHIASNVIFSRKFPRSFTIYPRY